MIGNDHEKDLFSLLETLKDTMESQWVMNLLIYGLRSGMVCKTGMKAKDSFLADLSNKS